MSRFLEISKKLSTKPRDKILANDKPIINVYFLFFSFFKLNIKAQGHIHGHYKDDSLIDV